MRGRSQLPRLGALRACEDLRGTVRGKRRADGDKWRDGQSSLGPAAVQGLLFGICLFSWMSFSSGILVQSWGWRQSIVGLAMDL